MLSRILGEQGAGPAMLGAIRLLRTSSELIAGRRGYIRNPVVGFTYSLRHNISLILPRPRNLALGRDLAKTPLPPMLL